MRELSEERGGGGGDDGGGGQGGNEGEGMEAGWSSMGLSPRPRERRLESGFHKIEMKSHLPKCMATRVCSASKFYKNNNR